MKIQMDHPDDLQALFDAGILTPPNTTGTPGPVAPAISPVMNVASPAPPKDTGMPTVESTPKAQENTDILSPGVVSGEKPTEAPAVASPKAKSADVLQAPIQPGSQEDYRQQIGKLEQPKTPWHDLGLGGKIKRVLGTAGNIGLDVFAPDVAALIPGTDINKRLELNSARRGLANATREDLERAQTKNLGIDSVTDVKWINDAGHQLALTKSGKVMDLGATQQKPESTDQDMAQAVDAALKAGNDPMSDPKVKALIAAKQASVTPKEGELPLTNLDQMNKVLESRYQVLNPGQALPSQFTLPPNATQKDYDRIDKGLEGVEKAKGTKAQQDTVNQMRQEAQRMQQEKEGMETVQWHDKNGDLVSGSLSEAKAAGATNPQKINETEQQKARTAITQYGRLIDNAQAASDTMPAWDNAKDKELAMRIQNNFFEHAVIPGVGIDPNYVDSILNSDDYKQLTPLGAKHMQNMLQLYSDAINMMKLETGGVPRGEQFLKTEGAILPSPQKTQDQNYQALQQFEQRIKKDSSEYARPNDMPRLGGVVPHDATHKLMKQGRIVGYTDKNGKDVLF